MTTLGQVLDFDPTLQADFIITDCLRVTCKLCLFLCEKEKTKTRKMNLN